MTEHLTPAGPVLVVEDSRTQAEYLGHILKKGGYRYEIAEDGRAALDRIRKERPSLILTDILMPGMDGYELCRTVRADTALADIPVIMVTQLFDPADVLRGLEAGADNFIIKPFEPEAVYARIHEVLQQGVPAFQNGSLPATEAEFFGRHYTIRADRLRVLTILISTYDFAIRKNIELQEAQERLLSLNEQLQQMIEEMQVANEDLQIENNAREKAERDFAQANKKLQLMASITRHDIVNHLTVLQGYIELSRMIGKTDPDKTDEYLGRCESVVQTALNTIRFTGDYQESGVTSPVWHSVSDLISNSLKYANLGKVRLENEIPEAAEVYADPLIEKVIFNLIENSLRYGSKLTRIRFSLVQREGQTALVCEDDGVGIPGEDKERVFSYGYGTNTGMGLFLVREILAITGITIRETGIPGEGARFEMLIPDESFRNR